MSTTREVPVGVTSSASLAKRRRLLVVAALLVASATPGTGPLIAQDDPHATALEGGQPAADGGAVPDADPAPPLPAAADSADLPAHRLREGTQLTNRLGRFRQSGESVFFIDEEGRELGGLPNLSLERVVRMLKTVDDAESISWSVSGTVTEFAGRNHLLISRAVYKAAATPPTPDVVE
jgi:hypothetical protein